MVRQHISELAARSHSSMRVMRNSSVSDSTLKFLSIISPAAIADFWRGAPAEGRGGCIAVRIR